MSVISNDISRLFLSTFDKGMIYYQWNGNVLLPVEAVKYVLVYYYSALREFRPILIWIWLCATTMSVFVGSRFFLLSRILGVSSNFISSKNTNNLLYIETQIFFRQNLNQFLIVELLNIEN